MLFPAGIITVMLCLTLRGGLILSLCSRNVVKSFPPFKNSPLLRWIRLALLKGILEGHNKTKKSKLGKRSILILYSVYWFKVQDNLFSHTFYSICHVHWWTFFLFPAEEALITVAIMNNNSNNTYWVLSILMLTQFS